MPLQVELVSPERTLLSVEAKMVRARTVGGGDFAILPGHTPFIGALETWTVEITGVDNTSTIAAVHGGFIEVSNDHVKILSDLAELADQIDTPRAQRSADALQAKLQADEDGVVQAGLQRAHARLRAAGEII